MSFPHFKTFFLRKSAVVVFRQQFKTFDSNTFTLFAMLSFQNAWPINRKAVYTLVHFHTFTHLYLDRIRSQLEITTCLFFITTYLILVNLQAVTGGKKCYFRW